MIGRENWVQKMLNDQMDKLCNNSSSQSSHPTPNPDYDGTGQPVVETRAPQTRSSDDSKSFNDKDKTIHDRNRDESSHEQTMDFRILGLPHSVVKHAGSSRVRELVKKIENHPDRHALQQDLQQNEAFNPFSP